jgi:hypothetical protein
MLNAATSQASLGPLKSARTSASETYLADNANTSLRITGIRSLIAIGTAVVGVTEALSVGHLLTPGILSAFWGVLAVVLCVVKAEDLPSFGGFRQLNNESLLFLAAITFVCAISLVLAIVAAPSAWDALSYHLPRINHWLQNRTVAPYPTHIDRQISIGPGEEYFALQIQAITGTDRFANLVPWASLIGCAAVSSLVAAQLGSSRRAQWFAALFVVTMPMAIAQASGSLVDLFSSFWVCSSVAFGLYLRARMRRGIRFSDALALGACVGLAVLAKATSTLFLWPFVLCLLVESVRVARWKSILPMCAAVVAAAAINFGQISRTYSVFGKLAPDPSGVSVVNGTFTPSATASNAIRNVALHFTTRIRGINDIEAELVRDLHRMIGADPNDLRTTYAGTKFEISQKVRTEGWAGNPFHMALALFLGILVLSGNGKPGRTLRWYTLAVFVGAISFCFVLRWQPWNSRLHLPLFVLASPFIACALDRRFSARVVRFLALVLFICAMPMLLRNESRPLLSRHTVLAVARERLYFATVPEIYAPLVSTATLLSQSGCSKLGFISSSEDWEDLLWVVMRNRTRSNVSIVHVSVQPSEYPPARFDKTRYDVCAVVSMFADRRPPTVGTIPGGFSLAMDSGAVKVFLPSPRRTMKVGN